MQKAATVFRANEVCQVLLAIPAAEASLVDQVSQAALAPMAEMDALVLQDGMGRPAPEAPLVDQVIQARRLSPVRRRRRRAAPLRRAEKPVYSRDGSA